MRSFSVSGARKGGETRNVLARRTKLFGRTLKIGDSRVTRPGRRTPAQDPPFRRKSKIEIIWRPLVCDGDHGRLGPQKRRIFPQATRARHDIDLWRPSAKNEKLLATPDPASCSTLSPMATPPRSCFGEIRDNLADISCSCRPRSWIDLPNEKVPIRRPPG